VGASSFSVLSPTVISKYFSVKIQSMIAVAIQNNGSLYWGNPVLVNITNAIPPIIDCEEYQIIVRLEKIISGNQTSLISLGSFWPDSNNEVEIDFSSHIRSAGSYKLSIGETYYPGLGDDLGSLVSYFIPELETIFEITNETIVETDHYSIPMGAVQLSGNPIQIIVQTSPELISGRSSFKRLLKITCAELFGSPFIEEIAPDSNLVSKFDISGLADQPVNYEFNFPAVGVIADHRALEFNVSIDTGETWLDADGIRQEHWNNLPAAENSIRILKGKLRSYELALLNEVGKNFNSEYINKGKFLTHLPDVQKVAPSQIMKLWFLSKYSQTHQATIWCKVYYNPYGYQMDYNSPVGVVYQYLTKDIVLYPVSGLLEFNVDPEFMGFRNFVSQSALILAYKFWLEDSQGIISEEKTFIVDYTYYETSFTFLYVNPLSGIDCIRLTGQHTQNLNASAETVFIPVPVGSGTKTASLKTVSVTGQQAWEINTGQKTRLEMLALRDFLESKDCWMVDPDQPSRLIPVLIEKDNFKLYDSLDDIQSLNLKILEA
jgi:hypothetical protein